MMSPILNEALAKYIQDELLAEAARDLRFSAFKPASRGLSWRQMASNLVALVRFQRKRVPPLGLTPAVQPEG